MSRGEQRVSATGPGSNTAAQTTLRRMAVFKLQKY